MTRWIEDWFGSVYYSLLYRHRDEEEAKQFLDKLLSFLKIQKGSSILDCGCGKGRHSIYLSNKGYEVTGLDISEENIIQSKKNENDNLTFFIHDLRNLFRINYYDVAISLFTSFGYFDNDSENNKVIRSIAGSLKRGGWFVLDFMNVENETKKLNPEEKTNIDGVDFELTRSINKKCIIKDILVTDKGINHTFHENVKAYTQKELETFFFKNNFEIVHVFGDYDLNPFNEKSSERLILIGKKK